MRLSHNLYTLGLLKTYNNSLSNYSTALGHISTGKSINEAKDNPAKISHAETLRLSVISNARAEQNVQDTSSMLQTFDGALQEVNNNVARLKELVVKANNGTYTNEERALMQKEADVLIKSIDDLGSKTSFNGVNMSDETVTDNNSPKCKKSKIGTLKDEDVDIPFYNISSAAFGLSGIDLTTRESASSYLDAVDDAVNKVSSIRSRYGSLQNRLDSTSQNILEKNEVLTSANSDIADADIAKESMNLVRNSILSQAGTSLMIQSNKMPMDVLNTLANM